jgi:DeoR family glycerol-3-phosphate regulon repressor
VARALAGHEGLLVITNNLNIASLLYSNPKIEVIVAGGPVRRTDGGVIGGAAVDFIKQFKVDFAVVGTSAIDHEGALLDYDFREVKVSQAIIGNSRQIILVADRSKFERTAPIRVAHMSQINVFVTDWLSSRPVAEICREHSVEVVEATGEPDEPD